MCFRIAGYRHCDEHAEGRTIYTGKTCGMNIIGNANNVIFRYFVVAILDAIFSR